MEHTGSDTANAVEDPVEARPQAFPGHGPHGCSSNSPLGSTLASGAGPPDAPEIESLRHNRRQMEALLVTHEEMLRLALDGAGLSRIAEALARRIGNPVLIENRFLVPLSQAFPLQRAQPPRRSTLAATATLLKDPTTRSRWLEAQETRDTLILRAVPESGIPEDRIVAPVTLSGEIVGYISIIGSDHPLAPEDRTMASQASLAVGVEFARQQASFETEIRLKGDVLDVLLQSAEVSADVLATRAALLAYDSSSQQTLVLLAVDTPVANTPDAALAESRTLREILDLLTSWIRRVAPGSLVTEKNGQIVILLAGDSSSWGNQIHPIDRRRSGRWPAPRRRWQEHSAEGEESSLDPTTAHFITALRRQVSDHLPTLQPSIALATPVRDWREVRRSYDAAHRALRSLTLLGESGTTISTTDPRLGVFFLFDETAPSARQEFVDLVLGSLVAYDQQGTRSLVATLEAYVANGGNLETTARALNVHTSTLKYRLQRIAAISGLNLRNADHRFNAALALKLRSLG